MNIKESEYKELLTSIDYDKMDTGFRADIENQIKMRIKKNEEILSKYHITFQRSDGCYHTRIGGKSVKRKNKSALEQLILQSENEGKGKTVSELFLKKYDHELTMGHISKSTYDRYKRTFDSYFENCRNNSISSMKEMKDWISFIESVTVEKKLKVKAFKGLKLVARGILSQAQDEGYITWGIHDMCYKIKVKPVDQSKDVSTEVFCKEEANTFKTYLADSIKKNPKDDKNLCLLLMYLTGMRSGEAVALKWENLDELSIKIRHTEANYHEGKKYLTVKQDKLKSQAGCRTIILPKTGVELLDRIKKNLNRYPDGYIFRKEDGDPLTRNALKSRYDRIQRKLGIVHKPLRALRKTYASILMDNKVANKFIENQMGHTSINITEAYYYRDRSCEKERSERLTEFEDFKICI